MMYCAFNNFQKVVFFAWCFTQKKFANFCHDLSRCKIICCNYLFTKSLILVVVFFFFLKKKYFHFSHCKMNANYAEICKVGKSGADFKQVRFVQFF